MPGQSPSLASRRTGREPLIPSSTHAVEEERSIRLDERQVAVLRVELDVEIWRVGVRRGAQARERKLFDCMHSREGKALESWIEWSGDDGEDRPVPGTSNPSPSHGAPAELSSCGRASEVGPIARSSLGPIASVFSLPLFPPWTYVARQVCSNLLWLVKGYRDGASPGPDPFRYEYPKLGIHGRLAPPRDRHGTRRSPNRPRFLAMDRDKVKATQ